MKPFTYERADSAAAAAKAAAETPGAKFLAGGTNLLELMKLEIERPAHLIDVGRLPLSGDRGHTGRRLADRLRHGEHQQPGMAADRRVRTRYPVLNPRRWWPALSAQAAATRPPSAAT